LELALLQQQVQHLFQPLRSRFVCLGKFQVKSYAKIFQEMGTTIFQGRAAKNLSGVYYVNIKHLCGGFMCFVMFTPVWGGFSF